MLESPAGRGAFAQEVIQRLFNSSVEHQFSFVDALVENVRLVDVDANAHRALVKSVDLRIGQVTGNQVDVGTAICIFGDFLVHDFDTSFDCIVDNPPYIFSR